MPTGYTYEVADGTIDFNGFVWRCARQFGALIHMRDEPMDAKIVVEPVDTYYADKLKDAIKEQNRALAMTLKEAEVECERVFKASMKDYAKVVEKLATENERYQAMLEKVEAFKPPTKDHEGLKKFMIEQLKTSMESYVPAVPVKQTAAQYLKMVRDMAFDNVEYYAVKAKEETKRNEGRGDWISQLAAVVPIPRKKK